MANGIIGIQAVKILLLTQVINILGNNLTPNLARANRQQGRNLDNSIGQDVGLEFLFLEVIDFVQDQLAAALLVET
jgi:hypothetical protein